MAIYLKYDSKDDSQVPVTVPEVIQVYNSEGESLAYIHPQQYIEVEGKYFGKAKDMVGDENTSFRFVESSKRYRFHETISLLNTHKLTEGLVIFDLEDTEYLHEVVKIPILDRDRARYLPNKFVTLTHDNDEYKYTFSSLPEFIGTVSNDIVDKYKKIKLNNLNPNGSGSNGLYGSLRDWCIYKVTYPCHLEIREVTKKLNLDEGDITFMDMYRLPAKLHKAINVGNLLMSSSGKIYYELDEVNKVIRYVKYDRGSGSGSSIIIGRSTGFIVTKPESLRKVWRSLVKFNTK